MLSLLGAADGFMGKVSRSSAPRESHQILPHSNGIMDTRIPPEKTHIVQDSTAPARIQSPPSPPAQGPALQPALPKISSVFQSLGEVWLMEEKKAWEWHGFSWPQWPGCSWM